MTVYKGNYRGDIAFREGDCADELISVSGYVYVEQGATFTAPVLAADIYYEIARAGYVLLANSTSYIAGCRGP